jgi:hypothetical protein
LAIVQQLKFNSQRPTTISSKPHGTLFGFGDSAINSRRNSGIRNPGPVEVMLRPGRSRRVEFSFLGALLWYLWARQWFTWVPVSAGALLLG